MKRKVLYTDLPKPYDQDARRLFTFIVIFLALCSIGSTIMLILTNIK